MSKPKSIVLAIILLWAAFALLLIVGLPDIVRRVSVWIHQCDPLFVIPCVVLNVGAFIAFRAVSILKISAGRHWARVTCSYFFGWDFLACLLPGKILAGPVEQRCIMLIYLGLQAAALALLFSNSGRTWFQKGKATTKQADS